MLTSTNAQTAFNAITETQHQAIAAMIDREVDFLRQRIQILIGQTFPNTLSDGDLKELVNYLLPDYVL
jgi:hypothetical protein